MGEEMRKIATANRKGGIGKTTTAVNIANGLALAKKRVLLIDTDMQGYCSRLLGVKPSWGLAEVMEGQKTIQEVLLSRSARAFTFSPAAGPL